MILLVNCLKNPRVQLGGLLPQYKKVVVMLHSLRAARVISFSVCMFAVFHVGCDTSSSNGSGSKSSDRVNKIRIAVIPKGTSHQFWRSVHAGAAAGAKEAGGVDVLWKGPETEADTSGQIAVVELHHQSSRRNRVGSQPLSVADGCCFRSERRKHPRRHL